jgi:uncharacterized SAM-binding protein YcdF (DUF218 family)
MGKWVLRGAGIAAILLVVLVAGLQVSGRWLLYQDRPVRSEVVILFVGPGFEERLLEARRLVRAGYGHNLLIPAYNSYFQRMADGSVASLGKDFIEQFFPAVRAAGGKLPDHFEATHVEIIEAKRLMDAAGFRTALFVSSPYHMRRIRLISDRVFADGYTIRFVPSRSQPAHPVRAMVADLRWLVSEYVKIGWFLGYSRLE